MEAKRHREFLLWTLLFFIIGLPLWLLGCNTNVNSGCCTIWQTWQNANLTSLKIAPIKNQDDGTTFWNIRLHFEAPRGSCSANGGNFYDIQSANYWVNTTKIEVGKVYTLKYDAVVPEQNFNCHIANDSEVKLLQDLWRAGIAFWCFGALIILFWIYCTWKCKEIPHFV